MSDEGAKTAGGVLTGDLSEEHCGKNQNFLSAASFFA